MALLVFRTLFLLFFSLLVAVSATAQGYIYDAGTPLYTTAEPVELGFINVANGNLHIEIPLTTSPQRGKRHFSAALVYDSRIWHPTFGPQWTPDNVVVAGGSPVNSWHGWRLITSGSSGHFNVRGTNTFCLDHKDGTLTFVFGIYAYIKTMGQVGRNMVMGCK